MVYVNFHIGDWTSSTRLLSATERGVYMDLLTQYYVNERPITDAECTRIARAYTPAEQEAMQYVLQEFFTHEDGAYHHARCEKEISNVAGLSEKKRRAAQARWGKKKAQDQGAESGNTAVGMQEECTSISTCSAGAMPTNTHYPLPITQEDKSANALSAPAQAQAPARKRKSSAMCSVERPEDCPTQVWADWMQIRKAKRLPLTQTAWDAMCVEAEKVGYTPAEAVLHAVERGWASFKAQWLLNEQTEDKKKPADDIPPLGERTIADYAMWLPEERRHEVLGL